MWRAVTEPTEMVAWLGRVDEGRPGPSSHFAIWHDAATRSRHTVMEWEPERLLALTWDFPGEEESRVTFMLASEDAGVSTVLTVSHEDLLDPFSYAAGWHIHLDYLGAHIVGENKPFADFWDPYDSLLERYTAAE